MSRFVRIVLAALALSCVTSYLASIVMLQSAPTVVDITFGVFPFLTFAAVLSFVLLVKMGKEKPIPASIFVLKVLAVACALGFLASLVHLWNDGSYYTMLTPAWAGISIASFGFFPVKMGPFVLVRFLPLVFAMGVVVRMRRAIGWKKGLAVALGAYLVLAVSIHALTWIGGAFALARADSLRSPADTFRVLVSAQADGYWTRAQAERFFATPGRQSDVSLFGIHAAIEFLFLWIVSILFAFGSIRSVSRLFRRLISRETRVLLPVPLLGVVIGLFAHPVSAFSYSDVIALCVFVVVFLSWLFWWRTMRDIEDLAIHEREQPDFPLPSGAVAVADAEALSHVSLLLTLIGSFVLGWPVLLAMVTATAVSFARTWVPVNTPRREILRESVMLGLVAGVLGFAALAVLLRDAVAAQWMFQLVFGMAFLVGFYEAFLSVDLFTGSRFWQAVIQSGGVALALLFANQRATWLLFLPAIALLFILVRTPESWKKFRFIPLLFVLVGIILTAWIIPGWIQRG